MKTLADNRLTKYQIKNMLAAVFTCIVFVGSAADGAMLILAEVLFYEIEESWLLPLWYKTVMLAGFLTALAGLVGCLFTKNRLNTTRTQMWVHYCIFLFGLLLSLIFSLLPTEAQWSAVVAGIGGAISTVGLFLSIASLIGVMKKPKSQYAELLKAYTHDRQIPYFKISPARLTDIIAVESYFGTPLPNDLVNFLLEFDGDGEFLYSTKQIIEVTQNLRGNSAYQNLCCIGQDGAGNHFCYQISSDGSIDDECIYLCKNAEELIPVADDLEELIYKYYTGLLTDEDIAAWQRGKEYNEFVEWWTNVDEKDIEGDQELFGAYQVMWYHNEVCNGGFDQFWDFAENAGWDMEKMQQTFKSILPENQFSLFLEALKAHKNGEDCEQYNALFDYDGFANVVLPQLAESVMERLAQTD